MIKSECCIINLHYILIFMVRSFDQIILVRYDLEPTWNKWNLAENFTTNPKYQIQSKSDKVRWNKTCGQSHRHTMFSLYARQ